LLYREDSIEGRLLDGEPLAVGTVIRWISAVLASPAFWSVRAEWPDLHQEAMMRVLESLRRGRFDPGRDFRAYVQAVARYTARETALKRRRVGPGSPDSAPDGLPLPGHPAPEDTLARRQLARLVMDHAGDDCRSLLRAYFYEQKSYAQIAEARGVPVGTIKSRLARCLKNTQRALARRSRLDRAWIDSRRDDGT